MRRVCSSTGLTIETAAVDGFRIAKSSFGPLAPLERPAVPLTDSTRSAWSRFDTVGSTIYLADSKRTAYLETLSPIRIGHDFRSAVTFAAKSFGVTQAKAKKMVEDDWTANGNMIPGWLPAAWRDGRLVYQLLVPDNAQWVELTTDESIAALNQQIGKEIEQLGESGVTLGTLTGENRLATTAIADWIREQVLDDGSYADGIKFHSKYGSGTCWAYWMRRQDLGLSGDAVRVTSEEEILVNDVDLNYVLDLYGAKTR